MNSSSKISHSIQIFHILTMILLNMLINVILILTANLRKGGGGVDFYSTVGVMATVL